MDTIILIPTYNEKNNLPDLVAEIRKRSDADILFIDDNSTDGTAALADGLSARHAGIHVLHRPKKEGIGMAYKEGFGWAMARPYLYFLMMDADLSHDPDALPLFFEKIKTHDAVFGSRYVDGVSVYRWSFARLVFSKFSNALISFFLGLPQSTDTTTAYKCFRRQTLEKIDVQNLWGKKNSFLIHLVYKTIKNGLKTSEILFVFSGRKKGKSKSHASIVTESTKVIFLLFFHRVFRRWKKSSKP